MRLWPFGHRPAVAEPEAAARSAGAGDGFTGTGDDRARIARLEELDRVRSEFLAHAAHELKTPLTSVRGSFELLVEDIGDSVRPQHRQLLDAIGRGIDRLAALTSDLIEFERLRQTQLSLSIEPVALGAVVQAAVSLVTPMVIARRQTLTVDIRGGGPVAEIDRRRFEQIVTNLLANANAYAGEGGSITVRAWTEGAEAMLEVRDSGAGVSPAELDAIFEPFYRGDRSPSVEGGSGLGLTIARSLAELHGGRIWAESTPGHGAAFFVAVPLASG